MPVICRSFQDAGPRKELSSHDPAAPPAAAHCDALHIVYTRIRGGLKRLGHDVGRNTIKAILKDHGIEPAPERGTNMPWKTFLAAHWDSLAAADFFTVEVLTMRGLVRYVVFFVMKLKTPFCSIAQPKRCALYYAARR